MSLIYLGMGIGIPGSASVDPGPGIRDPSMGIEVPSQASIDSGLALMDVGLGTEDSDTGTRVPGSVFVGPSIASMNRG